VIGCIVSQCAYTAASQLPLFGLVSDWLDPNGNPFTQLCSSLDTGLYMHF